MAIGVLALVGLSPERVASLTAAGYAVREGKKYASRMDALREACDTVRAVLTNGRGGFSGAEMALLPNLEIVCAVGAGYESIDLDTARSRGIAGAGLDVVEGEPNVPPKLSELLQFDNVVVTPHIAGRAPESRTAATAMILANLNAHFAGKPLPSPVSFKV